jgi:hypothetical protein
VDTAQAAVGSVRSAEAQEERSQTVVRGQDLARRAVDVVIEELNRRVRLHQLDRGLRLNLPYYNDWRLGLRWWDFTEIPRERILFVPAFVVLAAEREMERIRRERGVCALHASTSVGALGAPAPGVRGHCGRLKNQGEAMLSVGLLAVFVFVAYRLAPRERAEDAHVHGAGQIGLIAAVALFGVDYFTSYYYATGELMSALHPYGLQKYAYVGVAFIALANFAFGALHLFAIGVFNEGGSYTAAMRYLPPFLSLVAAVMQIEDYTLTIVVSALSGGDQLLSILNPYGQNWTWHFMLGAGLAFVTW